MNMQGKPLIIVSHARSGSHFLINSIRQNADANFAVQKPFFALDSLLVPGDESVSKAFLKWYEKTISEKKIPIIESKCLREDCLQFIEKMPKERLDVQIIDYLIKNAVFINIIRDPRQSLLSWYKLSKSGGAMTFSASKIRLANLIYKDFYKLPNLHKMPHKDFSDYDTSTVKYIAYHHYSWKDYVSKNDGLVLYYKDLNQNFKNSIHQVFDFLKKKYTYDVWPRSYMRPPNASLSRYYRKLGKLIKNFEFIFYSKINKKIFQLFNINLDNLKKTIESAFLSSQLPLLEREYFPDKETNDIIIKHYNEAYKKYSGDTQIQFK